MPFALFAAVAVTVAGIILTALVLAQATAGRRMEEELRASGSAMASGRTGRPDGEAADLLTHAHAA